MDVGATSLNKEAESTAASGGNASSLIDLNVQQVITNSATSRLTSLLSLVEPCAAAPKMPQQRVSRSSNEEEKASLPQPVATPSFPIPPHIMGRNVENPVEDLVAHGRRLQKPRLGVKVPYRNLTSQIVTQDELAQELLERSLKKYPVHDIPEGGDLFFAIKLTQRLANRLTPSSAQATMPATSQSETSPGKSSLQSVQLPQPNCIPPQLPATTETTGISDHSDLLAILEGDVEPDWVPSAKPPEVSVSATPVPVPLPHISNAKLDPVLEKELALKQLMEFQNNSRRRKSEKSSKTEKSHKPKTQVKKGPVNKENGMSVDSKQAKKRKLPDSSPAPSKKPRLSGKKVVKVIPNSEKKKTDSKAQKKSKGSKNGIQVNDSNSTEGLKVETGEKKKEGTKVNSKPKNAKSVAVSGKTAVSKKKEASPKSNPSGVKQGANTSGSSVETVTSKNSSLSTSIVDDLPEFPRTFATPLRTYSPKKRTSNADSPVPSKVQTSEGNLRNETTVTSQKPSVDDNSKPSSSLKQSVKNSSPKQPVSNSPPKQAVSNSPVKQSVSNSSPKESVSSSSPKQSVSNSSVKQSVSNSPSRNKKDGADTQGAKDSKEVKDGKERNVANDGKEVKDTKDSKEVKDTKDSKEVKDTKDGKEVKDTKVSKDVKDSKEVDNSKKRRMGEVDRLLMDEGAINLLYEAEHGDSKRRSAGPEEGDNASANQRRILKSVRRKKKDLLLKTKLVKNAVMRLSSSPASAASHIAIRAKRRLESPVIIVPGGSQTAPPLRKLSFESNDSLRSPPPLTPNDPSSPQSFIYPNRLPIPAEASRIIRRHSSSSNFSSRSASPNNIRPLSDAAHSQENSESSVAARKDAVASTSAQSSSKPTARKKGVPIFIRKPPVIHTYRGKRKPEVKSPDPQVPEKNSQKSQDSSSKTASKTESAQKKISTSDKVKLKAEMSKNFQKGFQSSKPKVKKSADGSSANLKKKTDASKDDQRTLNDPPDLSSCLAAAASAFAAEAQEEKAAKRAVGSNGTSHSSSPCPSRSSKSPTPTSRSQKKGIPAPLSPNAATYSNLLKTLENEKPRKKDGEEATKQRSSVRQNAGTFHYKEISLRRYDNLVQVILTPQSTKMKNAMNLQVLRELRDALQQLKKDETCRAVLLTSTGSSFCQGIDFYFLLHTNAERRKSAAQELAQALKEFMKCLALFNKPIVAGVHGAAVGLGVTMLPFFDMVFASDKATFYTPYAKLGQVPEGAAILTLPHMFGNAVTSELLFGCRKLTANEALHFGLVTRILWPDRFQEELIPVIRSMASQSPQSMEATKALLRHSLRTKLDAALESESHLLVQHWISAECQANFKRFLDDEDVGLQKQRVEA